MLLCLLVDSRILPSDLWQHLWDDYGPIGSCGGRCQGDRDLCPKGTPFQTASNETGNYSITHLIPDQYDLRASGPGFKTLEAQRIPVYADQAARVDVRFQVGAAEETVTVSAEEVPLLKTDRADVSTTFTERQVKNLPLYDRNFTLLALLTPGTARAGFQHSSAENPQGSSQIMVNGQHFGERPTNWTEPTIAIQFWASSSSIPRLSLSQKPNLRHRTTMQNSGKRSEV